MEHRRKSDAESHFLSQKIIKIENDDKVEYNISISTFTDLKADEIDMGSQDDCGSTEWPGVWNAAMWEEKKRSYPWIMCGAGKIGCSSCFNARKLGLLHTTSKEWSSMMVSYYGQSRSAKLGSLRKKIFDHSKTHAHLKAEKLLQNAKAQSLKKAVNILNNSDLDGLQIIFRTAYYNMKHGSIDYEQFETLLQLQSLNGLNIPYHLFSQLNFTNIVDHLASEMKSSFVQSIIQSNKKICLILDEFTRFNSSLVVMLYLNYMVENESQLIFLDLIEVEDRNPELIVKTVLECLDGHGFNHDYLLNNLVCFASDGANKTLGQNSSVVKVLSDNYSNFFYWQCLNHHIKESLSENIIKIYGANYLQTFMQNLYELYELSLKNQCEILGIAPEVEEHFKRYRKISEVGNVVNHINVIQCIWNNYASFYNLFKSSSTDQIRFYNERNKFKWLYEQMSSKQFLSNLALIYDVLSELTILAESLQKKDISLNYANKLINRTVVILTTMKDVKTKRYLEADFAIRDMQFSGIRLVDNNSIETINGSQLIGAVIYDLKQRIFGWFNGTLTSHNMISDTCIFDVNEWPIEIPPGFGDTEIESLANLFNFPHSSMITAFRDFLDSKGKRMPEDLLPLLNCLKVTPFDTMDCENVVCSLNVILNETHFDASLNFYSNMVFIKLYGPTVQHWEPREYVFKWLKYCHSNTEGLSEEISIDDMNNMI